MRLLVLFTCTIYWHCSYDLCIDLLVEIMCINFGEIRYKKFHLYIYFTRYREAGAEVIEVMSRFSECVERASIDEAYLDITKEAERRLKSEGEVKGAHLPNTFIEGWKPDRENVIEEEEDGNQENENEEEDETSRKRKGIYEKIYCSLKDRKGMLSSSKFLFKEPKHFGYFLSKWMLNPTERNAQRKQKD